MPTGHQLFLWKLLRRVGPHLPEKPLLLVFLPWFLTHTHISGDLLLLKHAHFLCLQRRHETAANAFPSALHVWWTWLLWNVNRNCQRQRCPLIKYFLRYWGKMGQETLPLDNFPSLNLVDTSSVQGSFVAIPNLLKAGVSPLIFVRSLWWYPCSNGFLMARAA